MVDKQVGRCGRERLYGTLHGYSGGRQQALSIDFPGGGLPNADRNRYLANLLIAAIARGRRELLRVSHFQQRMGQIKAVQWQHDRSRHDRPCQSAPPGFVYAGDGGVASRE